MAEHSGQNVFGSQIVGTQLTTISNTEQIFQNDGDDDDLVIDGNEDDYFHIQVSCDFPTTPVDNMIIACYATTDDSSEDWDITPFFECALDNSNDPARRSFTIAGMYRFRIGVRSSGATDDMVSADIKVRGRSYK